MPQLSNTERDKIVETMRAQNRATDAALWSALKRAPGLIAGGTADIGNWALGLITGRGDKGLVDKPIGGSESINEAFGMPKSSDVAQNVAEAALSMLSPGGAAKAIILPAAMAGTSIKNLRAAQTAINAGKVEEVYKTQKIYADPVTGELLKVIPDKDASLNLNNLKVTRAFPLNVGPSPPTQITYSAMVPQTQLSNVLNHPELYKFLPEIGETNFSSGVRFQGSGELPRFFGDREGAFVRPAGPYKSQIALGAVTGGNTYTDYMSTLLHEVQHNIQYATNMPGGGNLAQFFSQPKKRYSDAAQFLSDLQKTGKYSTGYANKILVDAINEAGLRYRNIPGEVQSELVQRQFETGDYTTHPLKLMQAMGKDVEAMKRAETRIPVDLDNVVQDILDLYAPLPRRQGQ